MLRKDDEKGAVTLSPFQFPSVCLNLDVSRLDFFSHLTLTFDHTALHATAWMFTLSFSRARWEDNDIMQTCHFPPACRLIRETKLWSLMKSKSFVWWWCISLVIDNLVSLVCTPVYVCVCVCSNEAHTPTCRQTPHRNTHTRTHTQCRKWEPLLFLWESTSPCSSQSTSILPLLLLHQFRFYVWHMQLFRAIMGETKLLFFPVPPSAEMASSGMFSCQHAQQCCPFASCSQGDETVLQCGSRLWDRSFNMTVMWTVNNSKKNKKTLQNWIMTLLDWMNIFN